MAYEWADKDQRAAIDAALEPPNRWDNVRRAPSWWVDEDTAWAEFESQLGR